MIEKSLFTYFIEAFTKNYANFKGRARRKEYWGFCLFSFIISFILAFFSFTGVGAIILIVFLIATLLPSIALTVRRLHDMNLSGWFALYMLIMLIPVIGEVIAIIISIVVGVVQGNAGSNKFGENPVISHKMITENNDNK